MSDDKKLPDSKISTLVLSIASTALIKMGLDPNNKEEKNMEMARYNIDLLEALKEKTKNNLTKEEEELLNSCVSDLQLQFIQLQGEQKEESK
ncbi:MAG: DUF1844 domain-containing protein [Bdellovibrionales bacterium]|nr:DUF1844 domain-containing protein [Bdellovibrionales bacterium]